MSDTRDFVTNLVANYIVNEGDTDPTGGGRIAEIAAEHARTGDVEKVREYVTGIVRTHRTQFAAEARNQIAVNDWQEIDWNEIARQLRD